MKNSSSNSDKLARVVLLGARGFIASAVRRHLGDAGINALALGAADIDLTTEDAVPSLASHLRPDDSVVMLSAITPDKGRDTQAMMKNLVMMQNVCAALQRSPVAHLLYFSSDAVYGLKSGVLNEASPVAPDDLYGAMHLSRELMVRGLTNIPSAILRVTMVYGPGDTHASYGPNRFFRMVEKDRRITLFGGGEERRDHIHVDDVALLTVACLVRRFTGLLNIATGQSTTFADVAKLVAHQFDGVKIAVTPRVNPITYRHYDVANLIKVFPEFRFTALRDGIRSYRGNPIGEA